MNSNNDPSIEEVLQEKDSEKQKQKYMTTSAISRRKAIVS